MTEGFVVLPRSAVTTILTVSGEPTAGSVVKLWVAEKMLPSPTLRTSLSDFEWIQLRTSR